VNFFLEDISESLLAACLFPIFLLAPGYLLGAWFDIWKFRTRTLGARLALGLVISFAVTPGLTYLLARLWSLELVCVLYLAGLFLVLMVTIIQGSLVKAMSQVAALKADRQLRQAAWASISWMTIAILLLSDWQMADRLYPNVVAHDYAWRIAVTDAITRTDVPPVNPDFYPGHPILVYYYYFWFMTCSLVDLLGGSWIGPRGALAAGAGWVGIGLMAIVALYVRLFVPEHSMVRQRSVPIALALLLVTGFDIVPLAVTHLYQFSQGPIILYPSAEGWNEAIGAWPHSVIWVPHHMAGLIATLAVFLVFSGLRDARGSTTWIVTVMICAVGLFSAFGMSIWITFAFGMFWIIWIVMSYRKGWYAETRAGIVIALLAGVLSIPYIIDLYRTNFTNVTPIVIGVRMFGPMYHWLQERHAGLRRLLVGNVISLPVNYFLEFGFFALAAMIYWRRRWQVPASLGRNELALVTLAGSSIIIATFLRSNIVNNDLGYRSILFTQFILLLWSGDVVQAFVSQLKERHSGMRIGRGMAILLLVSAVIGAMPMAYEIAIMKMYAMAGDLQLPARRIYPFLNEDNLGRRYHDFRQAYQWIHQHLPESAIVQHNPDLWMDVPSGLYANRQVVASDHYYGPQFGIRQDMYEPVFSAVAPIFTSNSVNRKDVSRTCQRFGITALVVKDTDPIWKDRESWVFRETPVFTNESSRVFECVTFLVSGEEPTPSMPLR
jgi:hypothetical protein